MLSRLYSKHLALGISDCHLHSHSRFDADRCNLLHDLGGAVQVDEALVDTHLEAIPGLRTFTTGGLTGGDAQNLGGHAHGSLDLQLFFAGTTDQISTHFFQNFDIPPS